MAVGCIDGSQFPVQPYKEQAQDYYNYKGWYSMLALAICDANYKVNLFDIEFSKQFDNKSCNQRHQI